MLDGAAPFESASYLLLISCNVRRTLVRNRPRVRGCCCCEPQPPRAPCVSWVARVARAWKWGQGPPDKRRWLGCVVSSCLSEGRRIDGTLTIQLSLTYARRTTRSSPPGTTYVPRSLSFTSTCIDGRCVLITADRLCCLRRQRTNRERAPPRPRLPC